MHNAFVLVKVLFLGTLLLIGQSGFAQVIPDTSHLVLPIDTITDSHQLDVVVVSASRISENILKSPVSIEQLKSIDAKNMGAPTCFDAVGNMKGVQLICPSLGFKVINTRGFANTTNVRFSQLIDGVDNQAPHIGAPIANALGANDLDIDKIEIIPGTASALYGMNAINGLANIRTKNPFDYQGVSFQQLTGLNHVGAIDKFDPRIYSQTNFRYGKAFNEKWAFKINGGFMKGTDWVADNRTDLASTLNSTVNLTGIDNPAYDEVNSYGNESSNRKTLTLGSKKYVVARTGYRETDLVDDKMENAKGDVGLYFRPKQGKEFSFVYKGALINTIYQRSNRFNLEDYTLHQFSVEYHSSVLEIRSYLTNENTGKSYNLRSLGENMDRAFKSDNTWFADYTTAYTTAINAGASIADAHRLARSAADNGRFLPGTMEFENKKKELTEINDWDKGAALRVRSNLMHAEALINWDKLFPTFFNKMDAQLLSGFDHRTYDIIPDGNYFINPVNEGKNLFYSKTGGFVQLNKNLLHQQLRISATLRADNADYFSLKWNPRFTVVYSPKDFLHFRASYQSGYRFPSIFEGFSNVNSGGVKRVGGLKVMSNGIFENSFTKISIDAFQKQVISDMNTLGLTQAQAVDRNKGMLTKNPYSYLNPEYVRSFEFGVRGFALKKSLYIDADFYYNIYDNFIAQMEASIPNTSVIDSIPYFLNDKTKQQRYRLWTNSSSKIYDYGGSFGMRFKLNEQLSFLGNVTYSQLQKSENEDGLEDGYNTPEWMMNGSVIMENIWKNLGVGCTGRYQTKFTYVSFLISGDVPSYFSMDAQINYDFEKQGLIAKIGATNLLNKSYYSMLGGASIGGLYYISLTMVMPK